MSNWHRQMFGTPRRAIITVVVIVIGLALVPVIRRGLMALIADVFGLIMVGLVLAIVYKVAIGGRSKSGSRH